ncbi:MAG: hypothetical protein KBB86_02430 [Candidatus Pacebacteria bacterium]|nr:hypothetical protein [Candidatus Paceibacterota bacterium]
MNNKTVIISYLAIPGIPVGFHQQGNCDIFTGDYAKIKNSDSEMLHLKKELIEELHAKVMQRIDEYDTIYIYMGRMSPYIVGEKDWPIFDMLKEYYYKRPENKVTIVGCDCSGSRKQSLIDYSGNRIKWEKFPCEPEQNLVALVKAQGSKEPATK